MKLRSKADQQKDEDIANFKAKVLEVLEYYADESSYESFQTLGGLRGPGILKERGEKARRAIAELWPVSSEINDA
jgi:hypothetical protein